MTKRTRLRWKQPVPCGCFRKASITRGYSSSNSHLPNSHVFADLPSFAAPIGNVTAAIGKEAILPCTIRKLGNYKVRDLNVPR